MGQYHLVVNLTKREFLHPHKLGAGLKLWEQVGTHPGTAAGLLALLACSNGRGGGDLRPDNAVIGRWAGDRIAVVGDYAEASDLPAEFDAAKIYEQCTDAQDIPATDEQREPGTYLDISEMVAALLERELGGKFQGDGWREFVYPDGEAASRAMKPDMVIVAGR